VWPIADRVSGLASARCLAALTGSQLLQLPKPSPNLGGLDDCFSLSLLLPFSRSPNARLAAMGDVCARNTTSLPGINRPPKKKHRPFEGCNTRLTKIPLNLERYRCGVPSSHPAWQQPFSLKKLRLGFLFCLLFP